MDPPLVGCQFYEIYLTRPTFCNQTGVYFTSCQEIFCFNELNDSCNLSLDEKFWNWFIRIFVLAFKKGENSVFKQKCCNKIKFLVYIEMYLEIIWGIFLD